MIITDYSKTHNQRATFLKTKSHNEKAFFPVQIIFLKLIVNILVLQYIFNLPIAFFANIMYPSTFISLHSLDEYFKCELKHSILRGK